MATYSAFPVFVDDFRLDSAAYNIDAKVRTWGGSRSADVVVPGVDGVVASLNDDLEPAMLTLSMWVLGTDGNGLIPNGSNAIAQCRTNLDLLSHVFGVRHRLLSVSEVVDALGTKRMAMAKLVDSIQPELRPGGLGRFTVSLMLPASCWQDIEVSDWSKTAVVADTPYEVTVMQGATAATSDASLLLTGPATNPVIHDVATGGFIQFNGVLSASDKWRVNSDTWTSRTGTTLGVGSLDTAGTDVTASTVYGGAKNRYLSLTPALDTGALRVKVKVTGTGFTSGTSLAVRARRKFLL
jgi:hypothetical protein